MLPLSELSELRGEAIDLVKCGEDLIESWFTPSSLRFSPNGAQGRVVSGISLDPRVMFVGFGNRVGKTAVASNILINETLGPQNEWFDTAYFERVGKIKDKLFIIASESEYVKQSGAIQIELHKWLRTYSHRFKTRRDTNKGYDNIYEFDNGCVWKVMSYEQDPKNFEGVTVFRYWADEPPPEGIWRSMWSRLFSGARILITATPLSGCAHIYRDVVLREDGRDIIVLYGDIEENCIEHGVRGMLNHRDIEFAIENMPDEERQSRAHGKFLFLSGNVFKEWDRDWHIIENPASESNLRITGGKIPATWPRVMLLDPHERICSYAIWVSVSPDDTYYVYDEFPDWDEYKEFYEHNSSPYNWTMTVDRIRKHEKEFGVSTYRLMDPRGAKFTVDQEYNVFEFFTVKMGLNFRSQIAAGRTRNENVESGHQLVRDRLANQKLKVFGRCKHFIYMMENYRYQDYSRKIGEGKTPKEEVQTKYKHAPDLVRYLCQDEPRYVPNELMKTKKHDYSMSFNRRKQVNPFSVMGR